MASGHRKRKAAILNTYLLEPAGLTNTPEQNKGNPADQNLLMNQALFGQIGYSASFDAGDLDQQTVVQGLLSDEVSGKDGVWKLLGYAGETSANADGFIPSNVLHGYLATTPKDSAGAANEWFISNCSSSILLYSSDGPQGGFNKTFTNLYQNEISEGENLLKLGTTISGAASGNTKLKIYVAGALPAGSKLTITTGSATPLITYQSSSFSPAFFNEQGELNFDNVTASFSTVFPTAISGNQPVSGDRLSITLPVGYAGLTQTASYTITLTSSLSPTASGNNMYISGGAGNINFTGSTFHSILRQGINGTAITNTSSLGSGFLELANYISASSATAGVSLFATYPSRYGYQIAVSGSNNKIKKVAGVSYFRFEPYYVEASFNTASMGEVILTYSQSATVSTLNAFTPGLIVYITGSAT